MSDSGEGGYPIHPCMMAFINNFYCEFGDPVTLQHVTTIAPHVPVTFVNLFMQNSDESFLLISSSFLEGRTIPPSL